MPADDSPTDPTSPVEVDGPVEYEIRVRGHLDARWAAWFDGLRLGNAPDGITTLKGPVTDQAALHGVLQRLRDVGVPLVSIVPVIPTHPAAPGSSICDDSRDERNRDGH